MLSRAQPKGRYTYGLRSSSILAACFNALMLLAATAMIVVEAIRHLADPEPVKAGTVMIVAAIGIVVNTATALLFMGGRDGDINGRGAFLHMAADAAVSAGSASIPVDNRLVDQAMATAARRLLAQAP